MCQQPSQQKYHPFCSRRCADLDLHRWLGGYYRIPTEEQPETASDVDKGSEGDGADRE